MSSSARSDLFELFHHGTELAALYGAEQGRKLLVKGIDLLIGKGPRPLAPLRLRQNAFQHLGAALAVVCGGYLLVSSAAVLPAADDGSPVRPFSSPVPGV